MGSANARTDVGGLRGRRRLGACPTFALLALLLNAPVSAQTAPLQKIKINYATRTGTTWPLYIAKEGGYYQKYGFDVELVFAVHPAGIAMVISGEAALNNYPLEQAMMASSRDGSLVMMGSSFKKSLFSMMGNKSLSSLKDLKGKRIGVSQMGDAPYNYSVGLLAKVGLTPRDVQWVPIGTDVNGRAAALVGERVDATMITAPVYFKLEQEGYKSLANISDFDDIYSPTVWVYKKSTLTANPNLAELMLKAHTEAVKRFYDDKAFAIASYIKYNKADNPADVERVYDSYKKSNTYERVPYLSAAAVQYMLDHPVDAQSGEAMKKFDFKRVIDNSPVDRVAKEGFFETLFGSGIRTELGRRAKAAFGK